MNDQDYINSLKNQIQEWDRANHFLSSEAGQWFERVILGTLNDEAIELLARSKTEEERMLAQQTLLASRKPRQLIDRLIMQGKAAKETLLSLPPKEDEVSD